MINLFIDTNCEEGTSCNNELHVYKCWGLLCNPGRRGAEVTERVGEQICCFQRYVALSFCTNKI